MEPHHLIVILCAICVCALLAHRLQLAPPIAFLFGGLALALVPGMHVPNIEPQYMLVLILPPILMEAAFFTSLREFKAQLRPILLLAVGLVMCTAAAIAFVIVHLIPGANWALGFVLGAIVSPPDAAAATSALRGAPIPRRILTILEGESLMNDATGIVLYKFAVAAVVTASFSLPGAGLDLVWKASMGIGTGLAIGYVFVRMFPYLRDQSVEILATFVPPYAAYLLGESLGASGVLATVACGLLIGWHAPALFSPRMRMPTEAVWKMVVFLINAIAFMLIGLQMPGLIARLHIYSLHLVVASTLAVCAATIIIRFAYVFAATHLTRWLFPRIRREDPAPPWQNVFLISWTGMRGVVTLALALALPLTLKDGVNPFPYRDLIVFLSTAVILLTLVMQGLTLPWLMRKLTLSFDPRRMQEEWIARMAIAQRALNTLEELERQPGTHRPALERIRSHYAERVESLGDGPNTPLHGEKDVSMRNHPLLVAENRIWQVVLKRERETLFSMRRRFTISDEVMYDLLREMDLLAARFHNDGVMEEDLPHIPTAVERRHLWQRLGGRKEVA